MGYNPYRKHTPGQLDYLLLASGALVALGLVIWALFG